MMTIRIDANLSELVRTALVDSNNPSTALVDNFPSHLRLAVSEHLVSQVSAHPQQQHSHDTPNTAC